MRCDGGEHRGAAKTVTDEDRRRTDRLAQMIGGGDKIVDVRREGGVGKLALAPAEACEVKTQHGDAVLFQAFGDVTRCLDVFSRR